jgi:hypothetical protein
MIPAADQPSRLAGIRLPAVLPVSSAGNTLGVHSWQIVKLLGARRAWKLFKLSRLAKSIDATSLQELRAEAINTWENGGREALYVIYERAALHLADWLQAQADSLARQRAEGDALARQRA